MINGRKLGVLAGLAAMTLGFQESPRAQVILDEGDFSGWVVEFSLGDGASTRLTSGGNPGAYLSLTAASSLSSVIVKDGTVTYDPGSAGPIDTVSFQADVIGVSDEVDNLKPALGFCLIQDGEYYIAFVDFDVATWSSVAAPSLRETDFTNLTNPALQPDFSSSGSSIEFGVIGGAALSGGMDFSLDNVVVSATLAAPIPTLPSWGLWLLLVALVGAAGWGVAGRNAGPAAS